MICKLSSEPSLELPSDLDMTSDSLTKVARTVSSQIEPEVVSAQDINRINGILSYDNASTFAWLQE